ncbi:hypothetical protein KJ684_02390 [Patescibacteria group bacterium]|nr:hypothetical protein [Patescibacteria group bacterium]
MKNKIGHYIRRKKEAFMRKLSKILFKWQIALPIITICLGITAIIKTNYILGLSAIGFLFILVGVDNALKRWERCGSPTDTEIKAEFLSCTKFRYYVLIGMVLIIIAVVFTLC